MPLPRLARGHWPRGKSRKADPVRESVSDFLRRIAPRREVARAAGVSARCVTHWIDGDSVPSIQQLSALIDRLQPIYKDEIVRDFGRVISGGGMVASSFNHDGYISICTDRIFGVGQYTLRSAYSPVTLSEEDDSHGSQD